MKWSVALIVWGLSCYSLFANNQNEEHNTTEHHNRYELEISLNDGLHSEFTGSVYFLPKKKIQVTAEDSFHHFASVLVQELPFKNSQWGTFAGIGGTMGFEKHTNHETHKEETEKEWCVIVQSGLAYAFNNHWSTGFTFSPGWDITHNDPAVGLTIDLVFGF